MLSVSRILPFTPCDVSLRFMPFDDSPRSLGPAESSIFILALETASPRCPLGGPVAQRHSPCFGSLHPAEETQVKSPGGKKTLKGVPWPPRSLQAGQECGAKEAAPVAREGSPLPSLWVVRGERLGEPCSGGPCPWPPSQGCPSLVPRSRPPASPSGPPCCLALCRQLSLGGAPGSALGEEARPPTGRPAESIQVCLKLPGDSEM